MRLSGLSFTGFIFTLLFLSIVFYNLLGGYKTHLLLTALPLLLVSQILLTDLVEGVIIKRAGLKSRWFVFLMAPGTILHELSHLLLVVVSGARLHRVFFFKPNPHTGTLGFVQYSHPKDKLTFIRDLLISIAPFFGCGLFLFAVNVFLGGRLLEVSASLSLNQSQDVLDAFLKLSKAFIEPLIDLDLSRLDSLLVFYMQFVFAFGSASSSADFENTIKSALKHPLSLFMCGVLFSGLIYVSEYPPAFFGLGEELAGLVLLIFNLLFALLFASQFVLFLSLPLVFVAAKYLELKGRNKLIPFVFSFCSFTYLLVVPQQVDYFIIFLVFAASTLTLRYRRLFLR
ncbi:MAG: hypothetical protein GF334_13650 [Candidatus Altiarchaeales archaeon]|nr:hypothetical protein [Candidatus Altiarchaeales archaeon]